MCNGQIKRSQRLPKNPLNGQIPAWNSASNVWEAVNNSLPDGTNADDILLWDAIGLTWYSSTSPFTNRDLNEAINGQWDFRNAATFTGGIIDPFGVSSPSSGFTTGADIDGHLFYKNSLGAIMTFRTASLSSDVIYDLPTETGTLALKGKTGIHFDADANISASLQVLRDPANNSLPISVSNSQVSVSSLFSVDQDIKFNSNLGYGIKSANDSRVFSVYNGLISSTGTNWALGHTSASGRLHVRGDGTNPILRFENGAGVQALAIANNGGITIAREGNIGAMIYPFNTSEISPDILGFGLGFSSNKVNFATNNYDVIYTGQAYTTTSGTANYLTIRRTFSAAAGSGSFRPLNIEYTINNSGAQTGTATGIFLNATETALNGMSHYLMDLQRGGISQFSIQRNGIVTATSHINTSGDFVALSTTAQFKINDTKLGRGGADGVFVMYNNAENGFNRLCFGGTSNLYPSIYRQSNTLEIRTADGLSWAGLTVGNLVVAGYAFANLSTRFFIDQDTRGVAFGSSVSIKGGNTAADATSILDVASTSKGVLIPRMTSTQRDAIVAPAESLLIYNTTTRQFNYWNSVTWKALLTD